jgi:hypothetical protein
MVQRITVDLGKRYQQIEHFGASGAWSIDVIGKRWSEPSKRRLADLLFSRERGIGLSAWRFAIGSGGAEGEELPEPLKWRGYTECFKPAADADYDWSAHEGQRWFLEAARSRGVGHFIAMAYAPPKWMAKNGRISPDDRCGQSNLEDGRIGEFAAFLADVLQHFQEAGTPFDTVSPVNEPSWSWNDSHQEGNRYTNDQIKAIVRALHGEIERRGLSCAIDIAEAAEIAALLDDEDVQAIRPQSTHYAGHNNSAHYGGKYREYVKDFLGDPDFAPLIGRKLSYHAYWADRDDVDDRLVAYRRALRETIKRHAPQARLWQTEFCNLNADGPGRDLGIDTALYVARVIHHDLVEAQVSSWQWWLAVSPHDYKDGLIYTDYARPGDPETIFPSKTLWALGHYSRFVRPGAERVECAGADDTRGVMASAYAHDRDRTVTIVIVHYGQNDATLSLAGERLPETMDVYRTTADDEVNVRHEGTWRKGEPLFVPGRSLVTLHGSG